MEIVPIPDAVEGVGGEDPAAVSRQGLARVKTGAAQEKIIMWTTGAMWVHAEVLRRVGRLDEAKEWATDALALAEAKEQHYMTAELHRTLGEIHLGQAEPDAAEAARRFQRALEVARSQHARFDELKVATGPGPPAPRPGPK